MIVFNSSERVIVGRHTVKNFEMKEGKKIDLPSDPVKDMKYFDFIPGNNVISKEEWEAMLKHETFKNLLANEILQVVVDKDDKNGLLDLSQVQAVKIVKGTFDEAILTLWKRTEKREAVVLEIDKQLDTMKLKSNTEE
jgi:hypothetical protein